MKPSDVYQLRALIGKVISPAALHGPKTPRFRVLGITGDTVRTRPIHPEADRASYNLHASDVARYLASGALRIEDE